MIDSRNADSRRDGRPLAPPRELAIASVGPGMRPMVFIGLGGIAARVLRRLRKRLRRRFGEPALLPSLRLLAIDTDLTALRPAAPDSCGESLLPGEMLHLPLRKTADYRSSSDEILSWLSRRWLYNIPRSLHTEGLRPLGRLAFVDHREAISQAMRAAIVEAVKATSQATSSQTMRMPVRSAAPRVTIVTSIGGGAGGGMLLDAAYAARQQLDELGQPTDDVCGLMLHAAFAGSAGNDLRKANAYATLTELNHFMQGGAAYRAGPMEVLPAGDVSEPPFGDAYLLDLGDALSDDELENSLENVAQYLYLDASAAGGALDAYRSLARPAAAAEHGAARLRSFGLHAIRVDVQALAAREADRLGLSVARYWLGASHDEQSLRARLQPPDLTLDDLVGRVRAIADRALEGGAETHLRSLVVNGSHGPAMVRDDDPAGPFGDELRRIHAVLGLPAAAEAPHAAASSPFEKTLREGTGKLAADIARWSVESIAALVERPGSRLPAATAVVGLFQERLRELRLAAEQQFRQDQSEAMALWSKLQRGELPRQRSSWLGRFSAANNDPEEFLLAYCRLRLGAMIHHGASALLQEVSAQIAALGDRLLKLRQSLQGLAVEFETAAAAHENRQPADAGEGGALVGALSQFADPQYVEQFEQSLQASLLEEGGLLALADKPPDDWRALRSRLHDRAREKGVALLSGIDAASLLLQANRTTEQVRAAVVNAAALAAPRLPCAASGGQLLMVAPRGISGESLADVAKQSLPELALSLFDDDGDLVFVREAEGVSLAEAAGAMIKDRDDCAAAARRLLTRVDVPWTALAAEVG